MDRLGIICYVFGGVGFSLAGYALYNVFQPVKPTDLTPIGHMLGFVGFALFSFTMISMAQLFNGLEQTKSHLR